MAAAGGSEKWVAPWNKKQIAALLSWQTSGWIHPYTCSKHTSGGVRLLPTREGWICSIQTCNYKQNWAIAMYKSKNPFNRGSFIRKLTRKIQGAWRNWHTRQT